MKYNPSEIEPKWQKYWESTNAYVASEESSKPKKYILDMFPYPSGEGLHVGHFKLYVSSDIIARYYRAKGFNVLHPMGWDAFGLPAENFAIKTGVHPKTITEKNISNIKRQMKMVGFSYDWSREINTTDPEYYKWTQWIFLKLFEKGLAYEDTVPINWCPKDKTGLANEEVVNGVCERCGTKVERREVRQWILRITEYADRLLSDLDALDWPESIKEMQRNWIGKSEGAEVEYLTEDKNVTITTFTTRVDTVYGVTAIIVAPEYKHLDSLIDKSHQSEVEAYIKSVKNKSELDRTQLNKDKTGVFTGSFATHPLTGEKLPIWVADYVLGHYGTGAVMLVPAHDERDCQFATKYNLNVIPVIDEVTHKLINSQEFTGVDSDAAKVEIAKKLAGKGLGCQKTQYRLRDWVFSRQRYWGEPIPLIHCGKCGTVPVKESDLPIKLPEVEKYEPTGTGESPLASVDSWVNTACPQCNGEAKRETNTMPQWAGSCWYYLRFCDPKNEVSLIDPAKEKYWMPVDWYLGGAEHAVLHLLYARFWHKFLFDGGYISTTEPFHKLSGIGLVLSADGRKMSKRWGNVVTPDEITEDYGADTLRLYEAFMGPFENTIAWDPNGINGVHRFLHRMWDLIVVKPSLGEADADTERELAELASNVASDIENLKLNTPIAMMMKFLNNVESSGLTQKQKESLLIILSPFAPHFTEEAWHLIGGSDNVITQEWPSYDHQMLQNQVRRVKLAVQVNGKVRSVIEVNPSDTRDEVLKLALDQAAVQRHLGDNPPQKVVYVPGKIINLVVS